MYHYDMGKLCTFILFLAPDVCLGRSYQHMYSKDMNGDGKSDRLFFVDHNTHGFFISSKNNGKVDVVSITRGNRKVPFPAGLIGTQQARPRARRGRCLAVFRPLGRDCRRARPLRA